MDALFSFLGSDSVQLQFMAFVFGSVRIIVFASFASFLGPQLTAPVLFPLICALYIPVHPLMLQQCQDMELQFATIGDLLQAGLILCKEALLGYLLAYICACIFYAVMSAGVIIDNQRGASQAMENDPLAGGESTPLGTVLLLAMVTLFFSSGAFMNFLTVFYSTYALWSPFALLPGLLYPNVSLFAVENLDYLLLNALLICAPFILVALMCDLALGLINRFAPQLNVFILSMPIKSAVCALLIIFYLGPFLNHAQDLFVQLQEQFGFLGQILGGS